MKCQEPAGFLTLHPCPNQAVGRCSNCGKPVCDEHSEEENGSFMCQTCAKGKENDEYYDDDYFTDDDYTYFQTSLANRGDNTNFEAS